MNDNRAKVMDEINEPAFDKPSAESTSSDKPNLTLLEKGQNPGAMLKAAREKMGLSVGEVSARTKINERQIEALESGDLSILPPATFAKAFIKSYCKVIKLDHVPVTLAFGFSETPVESAPVRVMGRGESMPESAAQANAAARAEPLEPKMPSSSKRLSSINFDGPGRNRSVGYFIVLGLAVLGAVFYLPAIMQGNSEKQDTLVQSEGQGMPPPSSESQKPNAEPVPADAPQLSMSSQLGSANGSPVADSGAASSAPSAVAAGSSAAVASSSVNPATPTAPNPTSGAVASPAGTSAAPVTPNTVQPPAASPASAVTSAPVAVVAQPATVGQSSLRFSFVDQSWVTVRDASNAVLMSQLNQPGSNIEVVGQGPFKVIVGNAKAVTMSHNGKSIDLNSSIRGEVARLTIQ